MCSECSRDAISQQRWITRSWVLYVDSIEWINLLCSLCSHGDVHYLKVSHRLYIEKTGLYLNVAPWLSCCWLALLEDLIRSVIVENFILFIYFFYILWTRRLSEMTTCSWTNTSILIYQVERSCLWLSKWIPWRNNQCLSYMWLYRVTLHTICLVIYSRITDWALFIPFHINYKQKKCIIIFQSWNHFCYKEDHN